MQSIRTGVRFECDLCSRRYSASRDLRGHQSMHRGDIKHRCTVCSHSFTTRGNLTHHLRNVHQPKSEARNFECDNCGRRYKAGDGLRVHQRLHTGERKYRCSVCCRPFTTQGSLNQHVHNAHHAKSGTRNFECDNCGRRYKAGNGLRVHQRLHTGECKHRCAVCRRAFVRQYDLKRHLRNVHNINGGVRNFECENCGRRCKTAGSQRLHQRLHTGEFRHRCAVCRRAFVRQYALKRHLRNVHNINGGLPNFECENCGVRTASRGSLWAHCQIHAVGAPLHCRMCPKRFFGGRMLRQHVRGVHEQQRRYECPLCGRRLFNTPMQHMVKHYGRRRFRCQICSMRFVGKGGLQRHIANIHEQLKPFACLRCGKGFLLACHRDRHRLTHKGLARARGKFGA